MDYKETIIKGILIGISMFIGYTSANNVYSYILTSKSNKDADSNDSKKKLYIKEDYLSTSS
jgi:hypothetical protein